MNPGHTPMMEGGPLLAGRYRLLDKLGEGGAAEVFRARDQRLDRLVAVKLLRPQYTHDPSSRKRFVTEAKTAAGLSHPHIVDIYDFGEADDGAMFIAMQFIEGQNLKDILAKRGRLTPAETIVIARQACQALSVAHAAGLIHRDVKPQNIMIDRAGNAHLTDFGIVKALSGPSLTQSGMTFGTAAYMSPEQATGAPVGPASDIYGLGCVMYEMLAGATPFTGENAAVVAYKQVWEEARPIHELVPEAPPSLERVVMRCLNKDPGRRYPSTATLAQELEALQVAFNQPTQAVSLGPIPGAGAKASGWLPAQERPSAEVSQPVLMPGGRGTGDEGRRRAGPTPPISVPLAHVSTTSNKLPVQAPRGAREVREARQVQVVDVSRRRAVGWLPMVLLVSLGLGLLGAAAWGGRNLLGGGDGAPTPTVTIALPTLTVPAVVVDSSPTPTVAAEVLPTSTPVPIAPTETPLPPTSIPTEMPATNTPEALPTDTPQPPQPTDTPTPPEPTPTTEEQPTEEPTPQPQPTDTPVIEEPPTPTEEPPANEGSVRLEDVVFQGGYRRSDGLYHLVTATWVYGQGTPYSTMSAGFNLPEAPQGGARLLVRGLDDEDPPKTPILVSVNGEQIFRGANPLSNDDRSGREGPGVWTEWTWGIREGLLRAGPNTLSISNLDPSNKINQPPFFMLDYAVVSWDR